MKVYHTLKIGDHHVNHCEDYLTVAETGKDKWLFAVMDGCSMGRDSYFAATLTGKLLRKIAKEISYKEFITKRSDDLSEMLEHTIQQLFRELHTCKNTLQLEREELLSTLLIAVVNAKDRSGEFLCIGDGLVCINGALYEFDQHNKPDYIGYHVEENFNAWYAKQFQRISHKDIHDFAISTDGIFMFTRFDNNPYQQPGNIVDTLLIDPESKQYATMLDQKLIRIQSEWGLKPADDLAIIRGIW